MCPTTVVPESDLCCPTWILEFLYEEYPDIYEDLVFRRAPVWLKPQDCEDILNDSIVQKLLLWADPDFIRFSEGFIQAVDIIIRSDLPVIHLEQLFNSEVRFGVFIFRYFSIQRFYRV